MGVYECLYVLAYPAAYGEEVPWRDAGSTYVIGSNSVIDVSQYLDSKGTLHQTPLNGTYSIVRIGYTVTGQEMPATPDGHNY